MTRRLSRATPSGLPAATNATNGQVAIDAAMLRARLDPVRLVDALRRRFAAGTEAPPRPGYALPGGGSLLLMPGWPAEGGGRHFGVKIVNVFADNGRLGLPAVHAIYALFDAATGVPVAVIDGSELTALRTAATSALAAGYLARADATRLLVVGAGRVAALLPAALRAVRPALTRVAVWNRTPEAARALARRLNDEGGCTATAVTDLEAAVRSADLVSCATLATAPLVHGAWLPAGAHLDLVGSYTPAMREADADCFARGRVWVDVAEALAKSGDLLQAQAEGGFDAAALQGQLSDLCRGAAGRAGDAEITVFKSVGSAIADLGAAELAVGVTATHSLR